MWLYEKRLQYPVNIKKADAKAAAVIIDQLGGPDGELAAALRYLSQRYTMPYPEIQALLTDIATEELAHVEIISAIIYQLTANLSIDEIKKQGYDKYFVTHTLGIYPQGANNVPFTAAYFQSKGDPITDLTEDMAAEGAYKKEQLSNYKINVNFLQIKQLKKQDVFIIYLAFLIIFSNGIYQFLDKYLFKKWRCDK